MVIIDCVKIKVKENISKKEKEKNKKNNNVKGRVNCSGIKETFNAFVRTSNICCVIPCIA